VGTGFDVTTCAKIRSGIIASINDRNAALQSVSQSINQFICKKQAASETNSPSSWPPMIINTIVNYNYKNKKADEMTKT